MRANAAAQGRAPAEDGCCHASKNRDSANLRAAARAEAASAPRGTSNTPLILYKSFIGISPYDRQQNSARRTPPMSLGHDKRYCGRN
jgi:hypothetical protein